MKTTKQLLGAVSAFAVIAMTSAPVMAQGTTAGSIIRNEVSVSYNVGNITQNAEIASDEFTVDQRVNVTVGFIGSATVVNPGQEGAAIAFDVTNLSNSIVDLDLDAALRNGTDANIGDFLIYRDTNGDRVLDATEEAAGPISFLDEVGSSATGVTVAVIVVTDISLNAANADTFDVTLTANAHAAGGVGLGAELVESAGNTSGIDTVLFDGQGGVCEQLVDLLPVGVAADHDHPAALKILGQTRHQGVAAEIQVEDDLAQQGTGFQGVLAQLRLAGGARPDLDAAILQGVVKPGAGVGAQLSTVACMFQQAFAQLQDGPARLALAVGVGVGRKLVIAHLHQRASGGRGGSVAEPAIESCEQR